MDNFYADQRMTCEQIVLYVDDLFADDLRVDDCMVCG